MARNRTKVEVTAEGRHQRNERGRGGEREARCEDVQELDATNSCRHFFRDHSTPDRGKHLNGQ